MVFTAWILSVEAFKWHIIYDDLCTYLCSQLLSFKRRPYLPGVWLSEISVAQLVDERNPSLPHLSLDRIHPGQHDGATGSTVALVQHDVRQVKWRVGLHWGRKHTRLINKHDETSALMKTCFSVCSCETICTVWRAEEIKLTWQAM